MITDDLLERGLETLGDGYDVPAHAVDDILDQLRPAEVEAPDVADEVTSRRLRRWPPTRRGWLLSSAAGLLVLVVVAFAVGGSGGNDTPKRSAVIFGGKGGVPTAPQAVPAVPKTVDGLPGAPASTSGAVGSFAGAAPPTATAGRLSLSSTNPSLVAPDSLTKIEETGELDLQVDKLDVTKAVSTLTSYAKAAGGHVADSQTTAGDGDPSATVTLQVPYASFDKVLGQAQSLGKILSVQTKATDVTGQYVDLGARLHALGLTKQTYLNILSRATTIGETLSVQQQINDIQTQIDQLQGQLKVLTNETTYSTLTVTVNQKAKIAPAVVVHKQSGLSKAVHRSVSRFVHGVEAIIGVIGPIVLVLLLVGLGWLAARIGYRIVRRQMV